MVDKLLTTEQAAELTGYSRHWFQKKRCDGGGPPFVKFDRAVRYKESDLAAWIERHAGRFRTCPLP
jgi:predicted DNA-binding transcriptional regulator AlpA